jgi:hypothetical protein
LVELSWFWGLTGTISSLLTPSPAAAFPDWFYFQYFIGHGASRSRRRRSSSGCAWRRDPAPSAGSWS